MRIDNNDNRWRASYRPAGWVIPVAALLVLLGVAGFVLQFVLGPVRDAWLWLDVWFLISIGIVQGMLAWAAVFRVAQTRWTPTVCRIGHSAIWMLPILYIILIILTFGVRSWAPWAVRPVPAKTGWLNVPFMISRDLIGVAILFILDFLMVRWSLKIDSKVARGEKVTAKDQYRQTAIGTAVIFAYVIVASVIAYDLIMALFPEWISTMFAPYYWTTNIYAAMAMLIILSAIFRDRANASKYLQAQQFQDMGNLMLGFGFFSMGIFFAQYLTIWYGDLPWETRFLIVRYYRGSWPYLAWFAFFIEFAIPFIILQSRNLKRNPRLLTPVAVMAIIGFTLERYVLVVPSLLPRDLALYPFGLLGILGFAGFFMLAVVFFMRRYSPASAAQAALAEPELQEAEAR